MILRDMEVRKAERIIFDMLTINSALLTNNKALWKKLKSENLATSHEEIKSVLANIEENSYGWVGPHQMKYFKDVMKKCKFFYRSNKNL